MNSQSYSSSQSERRRRSVKREARVKALLWPGHLTLGHKLGIWCGLALLAYLGARAGAMGLAHLEVIRVEHQLNAWYAQGRVTSSSIQSALSSIQRANQLHPDNPYQLTLQARLLEWRGYNEGNVILQDYREALALHQQAASLRPLWPDTWAEMAQIKVRLHEFDPALDRYLLEAGQLGPYTPAVHLAIAQANLPRLPSLSSEQRTLLETHLVRGVRDHRSKNRVMDLIALYGQQNQACQWLQGENVVQQLCPEPN